MIAIELHAPRHLKFTERPDPGEPGPGEVRVKVRRVGVCGTDWHSFAGNQPFFEYPRVLGHELGVEVEALGPGTDLTLGQSCAVEPYLHDPGSPASRLGKTNCCQSLKVLGVHMDGGLCPHLVLPADKLHPSDVLDLDALALVETLCIGAHGCERAVLEAEDRVLILGAGPIGLSAFLWARLSNRQVVLADTSAARLDLCRQRLGFSLEETLLIGPEDLGAAVTARFGDAPTVIMDATGNVGSMEGTFALAAHGGRIVFLGIVPASVSFSDPEFHRKELTLLASRNAPASTFRHVIAALESGRLDARPWITHRLGFDSVPGSLPALEGDPSLLKAMVELSSAP